MDAVPRGIAPVALADVVALVVDRHGRFIVIVYRIIT